MIDIDDLLAEHEAGFSLPQAFYTDEEIYRCFEARLSPLIV